AGLLDEGERLSKSRIRVVKSRDEFEGEIYESLAVVEGNDLAPAPASEERPEIGHRRTRIDGTQRVGGHAVYTHDIALPGMLHAAVLRSPYARARVRALDDATA